jgi:hypothetical protein
MDALQMAQYADSINFDTNDLDVKIVRIKNNGIIDTISLVAVPTIRDGDLFNDTIIIYEFVNDDFLKSDSEYELLIENKISGNVVSGHTELISSFSFDLNNGYRFGFYNSQLADSAKYRSKLLTWNHSANGKIYQVDMIFEYTEDDDMENTIKLTWSQPLVTSNGNIMNTLLEGEKLFTFLRNRITKDDTKHREFVNIDLIMTVGTTDLETYINVNRPITGIVQERPQFTNINNGIGIFSSRFTYVMSDVDLSDETQAYLIDELDRNFE